MRKCCTAQPPQWVKWRHTGAMRSGLASMTAMRRARSPRTSACTRSPGSAYGTNTCPDGRSATPSPCAPSRAMSSACVSPIAQCTDEKFDVAGPAFDGRGNGAGHPPPGCAASHAVTACSAPSRAPASRTMPPLPMRSGPTSNCGLTSATRNAPGAASSSAGPSALIREMKLTSAVTAPTGSGTVSRVSRRASSPSSDTTRGSDFKLACSWPWPTSAA